jgi:membrane associated rhomboid family serine protease
MAYSDTGLGFGRLLTPVVKRLLIANVAVFGLTLITGLGFAVEWLAFNPSRFLLRPWGAFTYMFVHGGFLHLALNMLVLFFFGPPLESRWGGREFLKYYVVCGMGGVALSFFFIPVTVVGASAAVYGLMLAFAVNWPKAPIYVWGIFPVQAKWMVAFLFVLSLLNAFDGSQGGGIAHFAHLGGLITGFLYLKGTPRAGGGWSGPARAVRRRRLAIVPQQEEPVEPAAPRGDAGPPAGEKALYDAVDRVLDKISAHGMASLTPEELKLLDDVSRRHRAN